MSTDKLAKGEDKLFLFLKKIAGYTAYSYDENGKPIYKKLMLAKLLLSADPQSKKLSPTDRMRRREDFGVPIETDSYVTNYYYLPLNKVSLSTRFNFAIKFLFQQLEVIQKLEIFINQNRLEKKEDPKIGETKITLQKIVSLKSEVKTEFQALYPVIEQINGYLSLKRGTVNYNNSQIILFPANRNFIRAMLGEVLRIVQSINPDIFQKASKELFILETSFKNNVHLTKRSIKDGYVTNYPPSYEKLVDLIVSKITKMCSEISKGTSVDSASNESLIRNAAFELGVNANLDLSEIPSQIVEKVLPLKLPPGQNLFYYDNLIAIYANIGGDTRMVPPIFSEISIQNVFEAIDFLSENEYINERFIFATFKFLSLYSSVVTRTFSPRKKISEKLEYDLINLVNGAGTPILSLLGAPGKQPSLTLSPKAYTQANPLIKGSVLQGTQFDYGFVQKFTMKMSSLVRTIPKKNDSFINLDISNAITVLSYASSVYKFINQPFIDSLKKERDVAIKNQKKNNVNSSMSYQSPIFETGKINNGPGLEFPQEEGGEFNENEI